MKTHHLSEQKTHPICTMKPLLVLLFLFFGHLTIAQTTPVGSPAPKRTLVSKPDVSKLRSSETCVIVLKITINSEGIIADRPVVIRDRTTTADMVLINQVIDIVQKEAVYSKSDKTSETSALTIKISAEEELPVIP